MKLIVTIEIKVEDSLVVNLPAAQEKLIHYTEKAIQNRLFGQGFLPEDIEDDRWTVNSIWVPDDPWSEDPNYPVRDWAYQVRNFDTRQGYWPWVASQKEQSE